MMKLFARTFFAIGIVLGIALWISPEQFRHVAVKSSAPLPQQPAAHSTTTQDTPVATMGAERIELVVNGVSFVFSLSSSNEVYIREEAEKFCISQREAWKYVDDEILVKDCVLPVARELLRQLNERRSGGVQTQQTPAPTGHNSDASQVSPAPSTVYEVNVPVTNGKTYAISFDAAVHGPFQVSEHFCRENAAALGLEGEAQIVQGCIPSVGRYIAEQLASAGFVKPTEAAAVGGDGA